MNCNIGQCVGIFYEESESYQRARRQVEFYETDNK